MRSTKVGLSAGVLVFSLLFLPSVLSAKERRGTTIVVTKLDGNQVRGELIAVKPDSLLLLTGGAMDGSIGLTEIKSVRLVRRSRAGLFAAVAGGTASVGSMVIFHAAADEEQKNWTGLVGLFCGGIGAVSGMLVGVLAGADANFAVAGEPAAAVSELWDWLRTRSREGRLGAVPAPPDKKLSGISGSASGPGG